MSTNSDAARTRTNDTLNEDSRRSAVTSLVDDDDCDGPELRHYAEWRRRAQTVIDPGD